MPFFLVIALVLVTALSLHAQEATPEPAATAEPASAPAESTPTPGASSAAEDPSPSPTPEASPAGATEGETPATPDASPSDDPDMIPLPPETGDVGVPIVSETEVPALDRPADAAFTDPDSLPPGPDVIPDSPAAPTGPSAGEIERKLRIRYQEVRTQVEKDPAVRSLLEQARKAKTSEDERAAYREYYRLLFKKMRAVDKELTARVDVMEAAYLSRLAQTRIEPTIPLNPPPVPEPLAN